MVCYETLFSAGGTVAVETPYGVREMDVCSLLMYSERLYEALKSATYVIRPGKILAIGLDTRNRVVYAAVKHHKTGFVFAMCAPYYIEGKETHIDSDDIHSEADGSNRRNCPLCVLEKLSPVSEYPYSEDGARYTKEWRKACLKRILRSRKASDADKSIARELLTATDAA